MSKALKVIGYGFKRNNDLVFLCEDCEVEGIVVLDLKVTLNTMVFDHRFFKFTVSHNTYKGDKARKVFMEYKDMITHVPKEYLYINLYTDEEKGERKFDEPHFGYEYVNLVNLVLFKDGKVELYNEELYENVGKYDEEFYITGVSENNWGQLEVFVENVEQGYVSKILYDVNMKTGEMTYVEYQEVVYDEPNLVIEKLAPIEVPYDRKFLKYYETVTLDFSDEEDEECYPVDDPEVQLITPEEMKACEEYCPGLVEEDEEEQQSEMEYDDEAGMTDEEVEAYMRELRRSLKEQGLVEGVDFIFHEDFRYPDEEEPTEMIDPEAREVEVIETKEPVVKETDDMLKLRLNELEKELYKLKELVEYIDDYKITELEYYLKTLILKYGEDEE